MILFLILLAFITLKRSKSLIGPLLSGLDFLCPAAFGPLLIDLGLLPGFPHKFLTGTVWYFDHVVSELHALKRHGLPSHSRAWAINQSPVLVDDINDGHQFAGM